MEKNKKDYSNLVSSIFLMVAVLAFIGGYALSGELTKSIYKSNDNSSKSDNTETIGIAGKGVTTGTLGFDNKYVDSVKDYTLNLGTYAGSTDSYFTLEYGEKLSDIKIVKYYYDSDEIQENTMNFVNNVVDVYLASFAGDPSLNSIMFLLENGDVCYAFIDELARTDVVPTYTTIEGLSNVVKFYNATSTTVDTGVETETTVAQTSNKIIYDLYDYIAK